MQKLLLLTITTFDDGGELEVIDSHPEGAEIPSLQDAQQ